MAQKKRSYLSLILITLVGAGIGWVAGKALPALPDDYGKGQLLVLLACLPLLYLLVIGWHELGHVAVGRLQGFRFFSLTVGPFSWRREGERIVFAWNSKINLAGGLALMLPQSEARMATRFAAYAAGGPLASLLLALLGLGLAWWLPSGIFATLLAGAIGGFSLLIFIVTILPFRAGGFSSDGKRILTLLSASESAQIEVTALRVIAFTQTDRPLRELPIAAIEQAQDSTTITEQYRVLFHYYRYLYYLATQDVATAETALHAFLAGLGTFPPGMGEGYYLEAVLFHAYVTGDREQAEAAMARFRPTPFTQDLERELAEAGLAHLRGEPVAVTGLRERLEAGAAGLMERAKVPLYRSWLASLEK
ncbi:MAG: hypothetical protein KDC54_12975 [Lewinella sp.]|nr:hypothetical protein [Lewinella sp.]